MKTPKKNQITRVKPLKTQLREAKAEIKRLQEELEENKRNSILYHFMVVEEEIHKHHLYFNPYPVVIPATYKNKSLKYKISPTQVICIVSDDRTKTIYLSEAIENFEGELRKTDKIVINNNKLSLERLRHLIDSLGFHLVLVSKGEVFNLGKYRLNKTTIQIKEKPRYAVCKSFKIGSNFLGNFQKRKDHYDGLYALASLQRSSVPYKK